MKKQDKIKQKAEHARMTEKPTFWHEGTRYRVRHNINPEGTVTVYRFDRTVGSGTWIPYKGE